MNHFTNNDKSYKSESRLTRVFSADIELDNESPLRNILNASNDALYVTDLDGKIIAFYGSLFTQLNMENNSFLGESIFHLFGENSSSQHKNSHLRCLKGEKVLYEWEFVHKKNQLFMQTSLSLTTVKNGDEKGIVGIIRDITRPKLVERFYREIELTFKTLANAVKYAIISVNEEYRIEYANPATEKMFGYKKDDLMGLEVDALLGRPKANKEQKINELFVLLNENHEERKIMDFVAFKKDGEEFHCEITCSSYQIFDINHYVVIIHDISERKKQEEALKKSEENYKSIFDNALEGLFRSTPEGKFLSVNPALVEMLGYNSVEELLKVDIAKEVYSEINDYINFIQLIAEKTKLSDLRLKLKKKNGELIYAKGRVRAIKDKLNKIIYFEGSIEDITSETTREAERNKYESQLKQQNIELEQAFSYLKKMQNQLVQSEKMASIGQLTAGIAHEINNPLAFVSSNLNRFEEYFEDVNQLLHEWKKLGNSLEERGEYQKITSQLKKLEKQIDLEFIKDDFSTLMQHNKNGVDRIKKIVQQLRGFSHVSENDMLEANLNEALDETLMLVWNGLKYKAAVVKEYGKIPLVKCNVGEIKQVFVNLLINAADAILYKGEIKIRTFVEKKNIVIEISDSGIGIPSEIQKKIFDPFYTTKPIGKGTGLGLWICMTIIQKHSAKLSVTSEPGKGTSFFIRMPI